MKKKENRLEQYLNEEEKSREQLIKELDIISEEIESKKGLSFEERKKRYKEFVEIQNIKDNAFLKYNNFIMDIRKPSFGLFILFVLFSIVGFIHFIIWLINLIF